MQIQTAYNNSFCPGTHDISNLQANEITQPSCIMELPKSSSYKIELPKSYIFQCSLNKLMYAGKLIPASPEPCAYCKRKQVKQCYCNSFTNLVGRTPNYVIEPLLEAKKALIKLCHELDNIDITKWNSHTKNSDENGEIIKEIKRITSQHGNPGAEMVTGAWVKLYEILMQCELVDLPEDNQKFTLRAFHLCEIPGGFVCALNHFLKSINEDYQLDWRANSLNPYHEGNDVNTMIIDDSFLNKTYKNWLFGTDETGDILKKENIENIWLSTSRSDKPWQAALMTADGSISVQHDPENQESLTAPLIFAELVCSLGLLKIGGSLVLKMFNITTHSSISILAIMSLVFTQIAVVKPSLSKAGNSEVYVLGHNYTGIRSALLRAIVDLVGRDLNKEMTIFPKEWIPKDFFHEIIECSKRFISWQMEAIEHNLNLWNQSLSTHLRSSLRKKRQTKKIQFVQMLDIRPIDPNLLLAPSSSTNSKKCHQDGFKFPSENPENILSSRINNFNLCQEIKDRRITNWSLGSIDLISYKFTAYSKQGAFINKLFFSPPQNLSNSTIASFISAFKNKETSFSSPIPISDTHKSFLTRLNNQSYLSNRTWGFTFIEKFEPCSLQSSKFVNSDILYKYIMAIHSFKNDPIQINSYSDYIMSRAQLDPNLPLTSESIHLLICFNQVLDIPWHKLNDKYSLCMEINLECKVFSLASIMEPLGVKTYSTIITLDKLHSGLANVEIKKSDFPMNDNHSSSDIYINLKNDTKKAPIRDRLIQPIRNIFPEEKHKCDLIYFNAVGQYPLYHEAAGAEIKSKWTFISGLIIALNSIKHGGDLIIQLSTTLTRFSVALIYLLHLMFNEICFIHPASVSDFTLRQFLFCRNFFDPSNSAIRRFLQYLIEMMYSSKSECLQIMGPIYLVEEEFLDWIMKNNNFLLRKAVKDIHSRESSILSANSFTWDGVNNFLSSINSEYAATFILKLLDHYCTHDLAKKLDPWDGTYLFNGIYPDPQLDMFG